MIPILTFATVIDPTAVDSGRSQIPEKSGPTPDGPTSRVVLMSQGVPVGRFNPNRPSEDVEDSDFDRGGNSDLEVGEDEEEDPLREVVVPMPAELARVAIDSGFRSLDSVTLEQSSGRGVRVVPKMMRGVFRTALRLSFQEAAQARAEGDDTCMEVFSVRTANVVDQISARWSVVQSQTGRALRRIRAWRVACFNQDMQSRC